MRPLRPPGRRRRDRAGGMPHLQAEEILRLLRGGCLRRGRGYRTGCCRRLAPTFLRGATSDRQPAWVSILLEEASDHVVHVPSPMLRQPASQPVLASPSRRSAHRGARCACAVGSDPAACLAAGARVAVRVGVLASREAPCTWKGRSTLRMCRRQRSGSLPRSRCSRRRPRRRAQRCSLPPCKRRRVST